MFKHFSGNHLSISPPVQATGRRLHLYLESDRYSWAGVNCDSSPVCKARYVLPQSQSLKWYEIMLKLWLASYFQICFCIWWLFLCTFYPDKDVAPVFKLQCSFWVTRLNVQCTVLSSVVTYLKKPTISIIHVKFYIWQCFFFNSTFDSQLTYIAKF